MKKIKKVLTSEKGIDLVNILFLLSALVRNRGIIMVSYFCWIIYLLFRIKNTPDKTIKIVFKFFLVFASAILLVNVYYYLKLLCV